MKLLCDEAVPLIADGVGSMSMDVDDASSVPISAAAPSASILAQSVPQSMSTAPTPSSVLTCPLAA
ncbi:hypothetical protein EXIGLDRAFT_737030 [Exidia glandulosa HHB12029]|uniref:Uncharacterized protein n=1 Tax=Exidia glandulosa HHB12029 TaxID=1314781 RepID=A0A165J6I3_EXIGL|nr:hypothetical protein EXIGLDRAFT_737030 [Exidia glandulosa HHB12029]